MVLADDFTRGLIGKSSYIRLAITTPRYDYGDSYQIALPIPGISLAEVFTESALLVRDELVEVAIAPFTITWTQPELLPSFSPAAVQAMPLGGRGYLYFALGADNQSKTKTQAVDPSRLISFYKMSRSDFLAELGRLLDSKTAMVDVSNLSVRWLNKSAAAAREFAGIADVVTQLRKEISERAPLNDYALQSSLNQAIANFSRELDTANTARSLSTSAFQQAIASLQAQVVAEDAADTLAIHDAIAGLQQGIDSRNYVVNQTLADTVATLQARITAGDSTQANALQASIAVLQQAIDGKQATGDYVPASTLRTAIASLQAAIDSKQIAGDYATNQAVTMAIGNLQKAIDSKNYVMGDAFNAAIATLQNAISTKQSAFIINASDYGARGDLVYREVTYNTVAIVSGTDTTDKLQAALNAAAALVPQDVNLSYEGSVRVIVPAGKYILTQTLTVPSNVVLDCKDAVFFNFLSNDWLPAIWGKRHSHATRIKLHANKKSGIWWGDPNAGGVRCDSYIDEVWVEHAGVEFESTLPPSQQKCGLRLFGLWFRINRIEVKEANLGLDIFKASDVLCPAVFLMGCGTALRLESAEQIILPAVAFDTNINTGIQIDNSGNAFIVVTAFTNSDGYGTGLNRLIDVGTWSGVPCKDIYIWAAAVSTGGQMLSVSNCIDSSFTLNASNARLFSQTSGQGKATSHWNPTATGGLLAHNLGTNYQPYGNEGTPIALVKYGSNLSGYLNVNLSCDSAIARVEGDPYGSLLINGNKYGSPVPRSILRMNCGGSQYKNWGAEQYLVGGGGTAVPSNLTGETDLIKSIRWGLQGYDIPLPAGVYSLNLWFIEPENQFRSFDINLQGQVWQTSFCIYDEAGMSKLLIKGFSGIKVTDILSIRFIPKVADAIITALEVFQ